MAITVIADIGNFSTKYAYISKDGVIVTNSFSSVTHQYKELDEQQEMTRYRFKTLDFYNGPGTENFYAGKEDDMYLGNTKKGHREGQIRLLAALYKIYQETGESEFNLILTSPYKSMVSDKNYFITNFEGPQSAFINQNPFDFKVNKIIVAAEGLGALQYASSSNCVILDAGSMTLNVLYLINGVISKEDSRTLNGGTLKNSPMVLAEKFAKACTVVEYDYPIICTGGKAEELKDSLIDIGYENVEVAKIEGKESYYVNAVGLLLKYKDKFEAMFA